MLGILNKKIFNTSSAPFGLDLSDHSVKVVQLEKQNQRRHKVRMFGWGEVPQGMMNEGEIIDRDGVGRIVRGILDHPKFGKIRSSKVICSLPEVKAFLRITELPRMQKEEISEAIKWKIEENVPLGLDQVYYDWQILPRGFGGARRGETKVLFVAVSKTTVDAYVSLLEKIGLDVVGMEVESLAQVVSLLPDDEEKKETVLVIDIGNRRTSTLFAIGGTIAFTSGMPVSSQMFTDAISKQFGITSENAEELKREKGIGSFIRNDEQFRSVAPILENLLGHIQASTRFFLDELGYAQKVDRVVVCGGGANTKGLSVFLTKKLGMYVERGNPWVNVKLGKVLPPIPNEQSIQFSTAIGLALQGIDHMYEDIS